MDTALPLLLFCGSYIVAFALGLGLGLARPWRTGRTMVALYRQAREVEQGQQAAYYDEDDVFDQVRRAA